MHVKPEYKSFGELFSESNVFKTPKYQRDYSWEDEQVQQFCADISSALIKKAEAGNYEHFFGGIVCAQEDGVGNRKIENLLVDGQQRLSTVVLFFSVLKRTIASFTVDSQDEEFKAQILKDIEKYVSFDERVHREVVSHKRIEIGISDDPFYQALVEGQELPIRRDSHELMRWAKRSFQTFLTDDVFSGLTLPERLDVADEVVRLFEESFLLIHIITTSVDDAYRLFMVLNDRGIGLTEGELLKAHTIGLHDESSAEIVSMASHWDEILSHESKSVSDYLRWSLIMITGEHVPSTKVLDVYKEQYFTDSLTVSEMLNKVEQLREYVELLVLLSDAEWPFPSSSVTSAWHKTKLEWLVKKLQHKHAMPVLLAGSYMREREFQNLVNELCKFFIRYKVVCSFHAGIFSTFYPVLAKEIKELGEGYQISMLHPRFREIIVDKDGTDQVFKAAIRGLQYRRRGDNKPLKYLMVYLEENWEWLISGCPGGTARKLRMEDKTRVFDFNNTTIEHLYPYSSRSQDKNEELEVVKNSIGNLVLLDPNRNASNGDRNFMDKKDSFVGTGIGVHRLLLDKECWSKADVDELAEVYADYACKVFSF